MVGRPGGAASLVYCVTQLNCLSPYLRPLSLLAMLVSNCCIEGAGFFN
jgi:hypothetical protein